MLRSRWNIALSYFRHKTSLNGGPIEISLESTAKCNLYCPMCPRHIYTFDNESMDLNLYRKIIDDCKDYVEFIWPYGIGEPMIHPNIFELIRITRDEIQTDTTKLPGVEFRSQRRHPCHLLWRGPMYVRYDGLVHPCCYMYKEPPVGDLKKQSVMEVWDSEAMVKLREAHVSGDLSAYPACQTCQAARPRPIAFYGSLMLNSLTVRKAVPAMEKLARFYKLSVFEKS